MNQSDEVRKTSGIHILWPNTANEEFKKALKDAADGKSPNNISAVIKHSSECGATFLWMGDLETAFMEAIEADIELPKVDILFAPHHGRDSGRIPDSMLKKMQPKVIIVGEAPSDYLHYYPEYNTITQNSAGDIHFECNEGKVHIFTSNDYEADFLDNENRSLDGFHYIGTLNL
jgi:beta-lactamase superfamily II metal-dependent hydrolase